MNKYLLLGTSGLFPVIFCTWSFVNTNQNHPYLKTKTQENYCQNASVGCPKKILTYKKNYIYIFYHKHYRFGIHKKVETKKNKKELEFFPFHCI